MGWPPTQQRLRGEHPDAGRGRIWICDIEGRRKQNYDNRRRRRPGKLKLEGLGGILQQARLKLLLRALLQRRQVRFYRLGSGGLSLRGGPGLIHKERRAIEGLYRS